MRKFSIFIIFYICFHSSLWAAPCYGTKMPQKNKIFMGLQTHNIFKRDLRNNYGEIKSMQHFLLMSYGVFDWLSIDLKGAAGNINQNPPGSDEVDYSYGFAGGYGLRIKLLDKEKVDVVFGFQHISVHPKNTHVQSVKNKAILDDWQVSLLASYDFNKLIPYLGAKWSRVDYIHWIEDSRKRKMSDRNKSVGLVAGFDIPLDENMWINIEGQYFDGTAASFSLNYKF